MITRSDYIIYMYERPHWNPSLINTVNMYQIKKKLTKIGINKFSGRKQKEVKERAHWLPHLTCGSWCWTVYDFLPVL